MNAEKTMWDRVIASPTIKSTLEKRREQLQPYVDFIQKSLSGRTLGELVYTTDHAKSIFSNTLDFPEALLPLPSGVDAILLKRILRVYLGDVDRMASSDPDGVKTKENYKNSVLGPDEAKKISDDDWKKKTLKEVIRTIGARFMS